MLKPFVRLAATACPLPLENVDTDQLIPARFMKRSRAEGYGQMLLHDLRFDENGAPRADFPLDRRDCAGAQILVARRNFGCGSSREAAVYALIDYGIRCILAPSFGDIFAANAVNNGLLPGRIGEAEAEGLLAALQASPKMSVDLETCRYEAGSVTGPIEVDPLWRKKLLNGWEDVDMTLEILPLIKTFVARHAAERSWAMPRVQA